MHRWAFSIGTVYVNPNPKVASAHFPIEWQPTLCLCILKTVVLKYCIGLKTAKVLERLFGKIRRNVMSITVFGNWTKDHSMGGPFQILFEL
jgi:hypothetical protein